MRIFAKPSDGEEFEVEDLFWFEEHGVHDFEGEGDYFERYSFRFEPDERPAPRVLPPYRPIREAIGYIEKGQRRPKESS
jgi:hypothetical protein